MSFAEQLFLTDDAGVVINPATEEKQDALLTELALKADLTETQPVSAVSLPLPTGAATEVKQDAILAKLNDSIDVNVQDQTSPPLLVPLNKTNNTTTLSAVTAIDDLTITLTSTTGFVDGSFITISSIPDNRYYIGRQLGAPVGSVVTVDTPLDFAYPVGATAATGSIDLNVNGSVTPQTFSVRASDPGIPVTVDITRIIFQCTCSSAVDLSTFGDIAGGLTNGIVLRKVDGTHTNIGNFKVNAELAASMYDFTVYAKTNPVQGVDGFVCRLTFAGQNKLGVAIRLTTGDDLEVIIQDDLSSLVSFIIVAEGHVVQV